LPASAGQDKGFDRIVLGDVGKGNEKFIAERAVHGVAVIRPVDRQGCDAGCNRSD
jgi:hypothetical protein